MTCDFCAVWSAEQWELFAKKRSYKERKHRPSGSAPSAQQTSPRAETSSGVSRPGTSSFSSSRPLGGQGRREGSQGAPGVVSGGAPSPPARPRSSKRGGSASRHSSGVSGLAPSSPSPSGGGGAGIARSRQTSISRVSESVDSPQFSPHVPRRENLRESSASCSRALSSRDSRSSGREPRKDERAVKVYLDRTAPHRPRCERLFVTAGRSKKEISKITVSFWLQKTISRAYELSGTALPVPAPRARETRGIAPSILFRKNFAVDQVLKAGTWHRHTTFTRHYLRDIAHKSLDTFHLGPVVAAQSVV